ncbi:hypothetical protein H4R35_004458, partial [Dimargaris xerosporica]
CVQLVLDINAELIQVCVEFQNRGWFQDPDFAVYQARLQSNLLYLATVADHFTSGQSLSAAPELNPANKATSPPTHPLLTKALNSDERLTPPDLNDLPSPKTPAAQRLQSKLKDAVVHFKQREQVALDTMTAHSQKSYNQLRQTPVGRAEVATMGARSTTATPPRKAAKASTTATTTPTTDSESPSANTGVDPQALLQMQRELDPPYTSNPLAGDAAGGSSANSIQAAAQYTPIPPFHTNNLQPPPSKPPQLQAQELKRQQMLQRMTSHTPNQPPLTGSLATMPNAMDVSATSSADLTTPGSLATPSNPTTPAPLPGTPGTSAPPSSLASPARTIAASAMPAAPLQANVAAPTNQMPANNVAPMPSMAAGTMNMAGMPQQLTPQQQQQLLLRHQQQQRLMASMGMNMNMNPQFMMNPQMVMHQIRMQQLQQMNATMMANAAPNAGNMFAQSNLLGNRGMATNNLGTSGGGGLNPQMAMSLALANQQSMLAMNSGGAPGGQVRNSSATGAMHSPNPMANFTMGTQSPRPPTMGTMGATPGSTASGAPGSMGAAASTAATMMNMPFSSGAGNPSTPGGNNNIGNNNSTNTNFQATAAGLMGGVGTGGVNMTHPNEMMLAAMNMSRGLQPNLLAGGATNLNQFANFQPPNSATSTSLTPAMLNSMMAAGQNFMLNPSFQSPNPNNDNNNSSSNNGS